MTSSRSCSGLASKAIPGPAARPWTRWSCPNDPGAQPAAKSSSRSSIRWRGDFQDAGLAGQDEAASKVPITASNLCSAADYRGLFYGSPAGG